MLYDRRIKYLDYYEHGERVRGAGFVKLEVRNGCLRMELSVTGLHPTDVFERDILLCGEKEDGVLGKIMISAGRGEFRQSYDDLDRIGRTGMGYGQTKGLRIPLGAGREISCSWEQRADWAKRAGGNGKVAGRAGTEGQEKIGGSGRARFETERKAEGIERTETERRAEGIGRTETERKAEGIGRTETERRAEGTRRTEGIGRTRENTRAEAQGTMEGIRGTEAARWDGGIGRVQTERRTEGIKRAQGIEGNARVQGTTEGIRGTEAARWDEEIGRAETERRTEGTGRAEETRRIGGSARTETERRAEGTRRTEGMGKIGGSARSERERWAEGTGRAEETRKIGGSARSERERWAEESEGTEARTFSPADELGNGESGRQRGWPEQGEAVLREGEGSMKEPRKSRKASREEKPTQLMEDKWQQLYAIYPHIHPFNDDREYISIRPADFVVFPAESYKAANNSFLLHGYYNYSHLILTRVERKGELRYYIGVPGNYYEREKQVAIMFGFESFECAEEPAQAGDFGYYMMRTEL
ncbi:hypothetical protein D7X48_12170 [bacterium D16-50]|nr:hypothetical protein D7X48_12170 [bacterium D16-50]